ncbi:unnamed protein product [Urochloa humidicola]
MAAAPRSSPSDGARCGALCRPATRSTRSQSPRRPRSKAAPPPSAILGAHPGPIRFFFLRWHRGDFWYHPVVDDLLRQPVLDNLQMLELSYAPTWCGPITDDNPPPPAMFQTLHVLRIFCDYSRIVFSMNDDCCRVDFPQLDHLTLNHVHISERALHTFMSRCPVLQSLVLDRNIGYRRLEITSPTLQSLGITDGHIQDTQSQNCQETRFEEVVIQNAPLLERFNPYDISIHMTIRVIHAPELKELGYLYCGNTTKVFKGVELISLTNAIRTVKLLHLDIVPQVDVIIDFLHCFPCVEELNLAIVGRRTENPERDVSLECLDAHLKKVYIKPYNGSKSQVQLIRFFLSNAKLLEFMSFECSRHDCSGKWTAEQREKLMPNDIASQDAKLHFS